MNKKRISAFIACCMAFAMLASGCGKSTDTPEEELTPNIITSADNTTEAPVDTTTAAIVTDDNGEAVTGVGGNPITTFETEAPSPEETLSQSDIEALVTAETTTRGQIVEAAVDASSRYAYNTLSDEEKGLYDAILEAASSMNFKIRVSDDVTMEIWAKVFGMVYNQEPQLFWLNSKVRVGRLYFNETDTDKIASMQKEIDKTVDKLLSDASAKSTTYEKLKVFHDYLVLNSTFEKTDELVAYNGSIYNAFAKGTSGQGSIQCSGYAKAMQYLCDKAGIDCVVITGTNKEGSTHAWNKVKVEGEWYNLDCTWDDPILSTPVTTYLRYNYFLVPDEWINEKTHFNVNKRTLSSGETFSYFTPPKATASKMNYFEKNGMVYSDIDSAEKALKKALDDAASQGLTVAHIRVSSKSIYDTMKSRLKDYQSYVKDGHSDVKGVADNCNEYMNLIQLDVKYN